MAVESHNVQIGEVTYTVNTFTATKGLVYLKKLMKVIGPALAEVASGGDGGDSANTDNLGRAAEMLFNNIDSEDMDKMIVEWVSKYTFKNGQPVIFDMEFAGNYGDLFSLVKEIIMLNYGSVFQNGFGGLLQSQGMLTKP